VPWATIALHQAEGLKLGWVNGTYMNANFHNFTLTEGWNGKTWYVQPS
jgi:hypothetical protein